MTLPPAEWRNREGLVQLADVLGDGAARYVGGAVRDTLLGLPVADIDIATRHAPDDVVAKLKAAGIRVVPTGIEHGTVTAVLASGPVEVTTLRRDVSTDGRRATVAFTDDWREDAARRDFTFNALYADTQTGVVYDYFDGLADLAARHVRFIGDPFRRIAEDHLRILRFFRFLARFGDTPDPAGLEACAARANDLMALSRERIADELLKLLVAKDAVRVVALMVDLGIFVPVLPEVGEAGVTRMRALAAAEAAAGIAPDAIRRLAALLPPDAAGAELVAGRLKLSNAQRRRLVTALAPPPHAAARELAYRAGLQSAQDVLLLADRESALGDLHDWVPPRLPVSGGALVERGLSKGPEVARALREIEDRWIAEGFPDATRVDAIADAVVSQLLRSASS